MDTDKFKYIQKSEVSTFLFTRIERGIRNRQSQKISAKTAWATVASLSLLLLLNLAALNSAKTTQSDTFNPSYTNSLYE
jgi:hypothetical protein